MAAPAFAPAGEFGPVPVLFNPQGYLTKGGAYYTVEKAVNYVSIHAAFKNWYKKTIEKYGAGFTSVNILEIYPFVNETKALGFVMIDAAITYKGKPVPGAAFLRGGAVAILTILVDEKGKESVVNTVQPRVPGAEPAYEEIPAGMLDGAANFAGVVAKELEEETGLTIKKGELEDLGLMYPSIGGCDEFIQLYRVRKQMPASEIATLQGKLTGNLAENESITLRVRPFSQFVDALKTGEITDAKAMSALAKHMLMPPKVEEQEFSFASGGYRRRRRATRRKGTRRHH